MNLFFNILAGASNTVQNPEPTEPNFSSYTITSEDALNGVYSETTGAIGQSTNSAYKRTDYLPVLSRVMDFTGLLYPFHIVMFDTNKNYIATHYPIGLSGKIAFPVEAKFIGFQLESHPTSVQTRTDYNITFTETADVAQGAIYDPANPVDVVGTVQAFSPTITTSVLDYTGTDRERIQAAIDFIHNSGQEGEVILEGQATFLVDAAVIIKDNVKLNLGTSKLKLADNTFDNIIRVAGIEVDPSNPNGTCLSLTKTENFKIVGGVGASIEGPDIPHTGYNPKSGVNELFVGDYYGWRGIGILLTGAHNYEVSNFLFSLNICYSISQEYARVGYFHNIEFNTTRKNGDGIDLRMGCKHIVIDNITGHTEDDTVALNAISGDDDWYDVNDPSPYIWPLQPMGYVPYNSDAVDAWIQDIKITNIHTKTGNHQTILLTVKDRIRYVEIDGMSDVDGSIPNNFMIEAYTGYGSRGTFYKNFINNINIRNITSYGASTVVGYTDPIDTSTIEFITQNNASGTKLLIDPASTNINTTNA